jgi:hypothetical protein
MVVISASESCCLETNRDVLWVRGFDGVAILSILPGCKPTTISAVSSLSCGLLLSLLFVISSLPEHPPVVETASRHSTFDSPSSKAGSLVARELRDKVLAFPNGMVAGYQGDLFSM